MSDDLIKRAYFDPRPQTFKALQRFVHSCAKANSAYGKKSLFGKDKYAPAVENMKQRLEELCFAIEQDGDMFAVDLDSSWAEFRRTGDYCWYIDRMIGQFKQVYPSWPDAYAYWDAFYKQVKVERAIS